MFQHGSELLGLEETLACIFNVKKLGLRSARYLSGACPEPNPHRIIASS